MDRRELLSRMGGVIATTMGGGALAAPALAGGPSPNPQAWLADLQRRSTAIRNQEMPQEVSRYLARRRLSPSLLGDAFSALSGVSSWRDLDRKTQQHPVIQAQLRQDGESLGRAVLEMTSYLETLTPEEQQAGSRFLRDEPNLPELLTLGVRARGASSGTSDSRVDQLERVLQRVTWRLSHQSPDLLIDQCVNTVDRLAGRAGLSRTGASVQAQDWRPTGRGTTPQRSAENQEEVAAAGEVVKHIGQLICLFGFLIGGISTGVGILTSTAVIGLLGVTAALLILVVGLVFIVVGAVANNP